MHSAISSVFCRIKLIHGKFFHTKNKIKPSCRLIFLQWCSGINSTVLLAADAQPFTCVQATVVQVSHDLNRYDATKLCSGFQWHVDNDVLCVDSVNPIVPVAGITARKNAQ